MTEPERTHLDLVREYLPGVTEEEATRILWTETPFPLATGDYLRPDLERAKRRRERAARQLEKGAGSEGT